MSERAYTNVLDMGPKAMAVVRAITMPSDILYDLQLQRGVFLLENEPEMPPVLIYCDREDDEVVVRQLLDQYGVPWESYHEYWPEGAC